MPRASNDIEIIRPMVWDTVRQRGGKDDVNWTEVVLFSHWGAIRKVRLKFSNPIEMERLVHALQLELELVRQGRCERTGTSAEPKET